MAKCRSCGAEIIWVKTINGKNMPIDKLPVSGGNLVLRGKTAHFVPPHVDSSAYVSHFKTCPQASEHRRNP